MEYLIQLNTISLDKNENLSCDYLKFIISNKEKFRNIKNFSIRFNNNLDEEVIYNSIFSLENTINFYFDSKYKSERIQKILDLRKLLK